jgi:uncharacterized protein
MRSLATIHAAALVCALSLCCWRPESTLSAQTAMPGVATNLARRWPSLAEVRKKWDGVSQGAVRQAAEKGELTAQYYLACIYRDGLGVQADARDALKWFRLAADQGHTAAMVNVGRAYRFGQGVPRDAQAAIRWFRAADERGDALGTVNLGWMFGYVNESPKDQVRAHSLFQKAADMGQPDAMYELYLAYKNGRGVASDRQTADTWLTKGAEAGQAWAQSLLGGRFAEPPFDADPLRRQPKNMPEAVRWYGLSADQGCARGQYYLGLCYLKGDGLEQDEDRGLDWIRQAADQGNNLALYDLAGLYARGIGEPRNKLDHPLELLKRVARSDSKSLDGVTRSAYDGILFRYQYGVGTERDLVAAAEWYCRAAADGVLDYSLENKLAPDVPSSASGRGSSFGGSPERRGIAIRQPDAGGESEPFGQVLSAYLRAVRSDPTSLADIGNRYVTGRGVPRNPINAWLWLTLAQEHGAREVGPAIAASEAQMTAAERGEARRLLARLIDTLNEVSKTLRQSPSPPHP